MAAFAVLIDFALQITMFSAILWLDNHRIASNRLDLIPCIQAA